MMINRNPFLRKMVETRTPWKINMEPENDGLEDDIPFQLGDLRFHVNLPGCNFQLSTNKTC